MKRKYESEQRASAVLKEALYLAWIAAGGTRGMGTLQDNPNADKECVWDQAYNKKDYFGRHPSDGKDLNADYVFGRMVKLSVSRPSDTELDIPDHEPRSDYQSWCRKYPSYAALFDAAERKPIDD